MVEALGGIGLLCLIYGALGLVLWRSQFGKSDRALKWLGHGLSFSVNQFLARLFTFVGIGLLVAAAIAALIID